MIAPISFDFMSLPAQTSASRKAEPLPSGARDGMGMDPEVSLFASMMTQGIKPHAENDDEE